MIGQSTKIMKKIQLVIKGDRDREMLPVALTRKYFTIKLINWNNDWNDLLNDFLKVTDMRVLVFSKCNIITNKDVQDFNKFFYSATKLESLRIEELYEENNVMLLKPIIQVDYQTLRYLHGLRHFRFFISVFKSRRNKAIKKLGTR